MVLLRNIRDCDKNMIFELGCLLFREEDEIPDLQKALAFCIPELSYVAIEDKIIIGFTIICKKLTTIHYPFLQTIENGYELSFFGISPKCQGRGLGSRLLKETLLAIFQQPNPSTCWLIVDTTNVIAHKMYEKLGFRIWRTIETKYPYHLMGISYRRYCATLNSHPIG